MTACEFPNKQAFDTKGDALDAWRGIRREDRTRARRLRRAPTLHPYRCPAGHWHLGRIKRRYR